MARATLVALHLSLALAGALGCRSVPANAEALQAVESPSSEGEAQPWLADEPVPEGFETAPQLALDVATPDVECQLLQDALVFYEFGKPTLMPRSDVVVRELARLMHENPTWVVEVGVHTDSRGSAAFNGALSKKRARAVVAALVALGIHPERLRAVGFGESQPIASNETEQGRSRNRRTEFLRKDGPCRPRD